MRLDQVGSSRIFLLLDKARLSKRSSRNFNHQAVAFAAV